MGTIWTKTSKLPAFSPLAQSVRAEVAVIGGGIAGILTAFFLKRAGIDVIVLEGNRVGSGQTAGTTAKITISHNLIYEKLFREAGEEKARKYVSANKRALKMYSRLVQVCAVSLGCAWYVWADTEWHRERAAMGDGLRGEVRGRGRRGGRGAKALEGGGNAGMV